MIKHFRGLILAIVYHKEDDGLIADLGFYPLFILSIEKATAIFLLLESHGLVPTQLPVYPHRS